MYYKYAQINLESGAIDGISQLSGEVIADHMIPIDEDFDPTNKYYIDGEWVVIEPEPEPTPEPEEPLITDEEITTAIAEGVASV